MAKALSVDQAMRQAKALVAQGKTNEARAIYQDVLKRFPANKRAAKALKALRTDTRAEVHGRIRAELQGLIELFNQGKHDDVIAQAEEMAKTLTNLPILPNMIGAALSAKGEYAEAVSKYEAAIALDPTLVPAHNNLGAAKAELGEFEEAIQHYDEALQIDPTYAQAHHNKANALRQQGQFDEAVGSYREAIRLNGQLADAHGNLGTCLIETGDLEAGLESLAQAVVLDPAKTDFARRRAQLLQGLSRLEEALDAYDLVIERDPKPGDLIARGGVLAALNRPDQAIDSFRSALTTDPSLTQGWSGLCAAFDAAGKIPDLAEAVAEASEAVGAWEAEIRFWSGVLAARQGEYAQACEMLDAIFAEELPHPLQVKQAQTIAEARDRLGKTAEAFQSAEQMNALIGAGPAAPSVDPLRAVDDIAEVKLSLDDVSAAEGAATEGGSDLTFLVGMPGPALVRLETILAGHPAIQLIKGGRMSSTAKALVDGPATRPVLDGLSEAQLETMRTAYRGGLSGGQGSIAQIIDSQPLNIAHVPLLHRLFPEARFLLLLEHPCDAVLGAFMANLPLDDMTANLIDLEDTAAFYSLAMGVWTGAQEGLALNAYQIRIEALNTDPEAALQPFLGDLGLDWADDMGGFWEPVRSRWQGYPQIEPVLDTLQPWAQRLGYEI
ncbi:MAG: tetratricopeptide repeat protein [Pseudomonadota bacterium]